MTQPSLFESEVGIDCFFGCGHVVRTSDPVEAHDAMEEHYETRHRLQINRIVGAA